VLALPASVSALVSESFNKWRITALRRSKIAKSLSKRKREAHSREGGQIESPTRREFQFDSLRLSIQREEPTFRKNPRKIVIQLLRSPIVEIHQCHQIHEGVLISWSKCSDEITAGDLHRFVRRFVAAHVASEAGETCADMRAYLSPVVQVISAGDRLPAEDVDIARAKNYGTCDQKRARAYHLTRAKISDRWRGCMSLPGECGTHRNVERGQRFAASAVKHPGSASSSRSSLGDR
jgi:hypothetical protein